MRFRLQRVWPALVMASVLASFLVAPAVAHAADSLWWNRNYIGPANIPNEPQDPIPVAGAFNGVSFAGPSNGWAVGLKVENAVFGGGFRKGLVVSTHDGGVTWAPDSIDTTRELNAVDAVSATSVWAAGNYGAVYHWNGTSWNQDSVPGWPATKNFNGISFADANNGWIVGDSGGVVFTSDGGATWKIIKAPSGGYALRAVAAVTASKAMAVGDGGVMLALTATSTTARSSATGAHLYGITFADASHAWAVGENATVVKSSDGGATWATATRAMPGGLTASALVMRSVAFAGPYDGIIVGTYDMVWRTSDSGATWVPGQLVDLSWFADMELRGAAFAGSAAAPVTVSRHGFLDVHSSDQKARAYLGAWTGITLPAPFPPSGVTAADGGAPRPSITVSWTDNSPDEDGFRIERRQGATGAWTFAANVAADVTSCADTSADWSSPWYYRVSSFRGALSSAWAVSGPFTVDAVAPSTTSNAFRAYSASATIDFVATDNAGGSGVAHTYSTIDGADQVEGTSRVVAAFGTHRLGFWSVDVAGNIEAAHSVDLYVSDPLVPDVTPPTTVSNAVAFYASSATIVLSAADGADGSGVLHTYYRIDSGARTESTTARITGSGAHKLAFWSEDLVGNVEATHTVSFTILSVPSSKGTPTTPSTPSSVKHGVAFTSWGYVIRHTAGTSPIMLQFYRYQSGHWVLRKSATASVSNMLTFSKYSRSTSVPYTGKWRVRARHTVNGKYVYSGYRSFTAR
jgi:photosystem II stability/assembly factor-like uncharacterized protein